MCLTGLDTLDVNHANDKLEEVQNSNKDCEGFISNTL